MISGFRLMYRASFAVLILVCSASAQLSLRIDSVDLAAYPTVRVHATTKMGLMLRKDLAASNFTVTEDGFRQSPLILKGTHGDTPYALAMCIAVGSSISAGDMVFAAGVGNKLVDSLNCPVDEMGVFVYDATLQSLSQPDLNCNYNTLRANLATLGTTGLGNRFWDGVYYGIEKLALNSVNSPRALFVLSNGFDDGSTHNLNDCLTLARTTSIKVHTLNIGGSAGISNLQAISQGTNGRYFSSPDEAVQDIVNELRGTPSYSILEYTTDFQCRDGLARALGVRVRIDNDSVTANTQYLLPADPASKVEATFAVDTGSVTSGKTATIGLLLKTTVTGQRFVPVVIDLAFDTAKLTLVTASADKAMLENNSIAVTPTATGATLNVGGISRLNGKGRLFKLEFTGADVTSNTPVPVTITSMNFSGGCLTPKLEAGSVKVLPKNYGLQCTGKVYTFTWNDATKDYDPATAVITMDVMNDGDLPVSGLIGTLPVTPELKLVHGSTRSMPVVPGSLAPGEKGTVQWTVKAIPRADEKGLQFDAVARSAEGAQDSARMFVNIKAATSAVVVTADIDTVRVSGGAHTPDPAQVRATVRSAGTQTGPAGTIDIVLGAGLALHSGSSASQPFAALAPNATAPFEWSVDYPKDLPRDSSFTVLLVRSAAGYTNDTTRLTLRIPLLSGPAYETTCIETASPLAYDPAKRGYPDVTLTARVKNTGAGAGGQLEGRIELPSRTMLAQGEHVLKLVSASLPSGDSAFVSWVVKIISDGCTADTLVFKYTLNDGVTDVRVCSFPLVLLPRANTAPSIVSQSPGKLDTLARDKQQLFRVAAQDAENDTLLYTWIVDGVTQPATGDSYNAIFSTVGQKTVRCIIRDNCGATVEATWTFLVQILGVDGVIADEGFRFIGNHPNPFTRATQIEFTLPEGARDVTLDVLDAAGRIVATLVSGRQTGGLHRASFEGRGLPSGVYTARLRSGGTTRSMRMLLSK